MVAVPSPVVRRALVVALALGSVLVVVPLVLALQERDDFRDSAYLRVDPDRIIISPRDSQVPCGECHSSEYEVWKGTAHATGFETMHRTPSAQAILDSMGLRVAKRQESLCMRCHYTVSPKRRAVAGVSCESCHGPARDWIKIHDDLGDETRVQKSEAAGMFRPSGDVYAVAANCFECHTVPMERLVNQGRHTTGSGSFELVEWADRIRHNFLHQQRGDDSGNREPTIERKRVMFVVGRMLAYEFGLRGLAVATVEARYSRSVGRRVKDAFVELEGLGRIAAIPEVTEILTLGAALDLVPNNEAALYTAAEQIRVLGRRFTAANDGSGLMALDPLLAGEPAPPPLFDPPPDPDPPGGGGGTTPSSPPSEQVTGAAGPSAPTAAQASAASTEASAVATEATAPMLPGEIRNTPEWFTNPEHATTLPDCVGCHVQAEEWYYDANPHRSSHQRLVNKDPTAVSIATLYGLGEGEMSLGDRICMSCHGTAKSAARAVAVREGVSCESCHGGSEAYLEPHKAGGDPFALGMTRLKDAEGRAANCSRCHLVSDTRLLAAGHRSGKDYNFVEANRSIEHFPDGRVQNARDGAYPAVDDVALRAAYQMISAGRPVPTVTVVPLPRPPVRLLAPAGSRASTSNTGATTGEPPTVVEPPARVPGAGEVNANGEPSWISSPPTPPGVLPAPRVARSGPIVLDGVEPIPDSTDGITTEDLILLVKRRLDRLYQVLGRGN